MNCRTPQSTHHTYHINSRLSIRACTCRLMTFLHAATSARPTGSERLYNNAFCSRTTVFCGKKNNIPPAGFQNVAIFTARCYARAAYAIMRCVCVSACLSRSYILLKQIKISSKCFHHRETSHSSFPVPDVRHGNIPTRTPLTDASNAGGVGLNRDSEPICGFTSCC